MRVPVILSLLATLAAALMAYGTDPRWVEQPGGLGVIMFARRLQWPLVAASLVLCLALLALVISGKRRAWWLIALAPVLALFVHRFLTAPSNRYAILDEPAFVAAADARHVRDEDYVVGVVFNEKSYAYPYAALWHAPVIVQSDRERRMLLVWSAYANAATPLAVSRELKARDLDIVGDPADSLLLYNGRTGEFLVGLSGRTPGGGKPTGVDAALPCAKQTWRQWRTAHPETRVLAVAGAGPAGPVQPRWPTPNVRAASAPAAAAASALTAKLPVTIVAHGDAELALRSDDVGAAPLNLRVGDTPVLVFRDRVSGEVRAFDRRLEADLIPQFTLPRDARRKDKGVAVVDADTSTGWSARGVAVDGPKDWRGKKLTPVDVREDIYLGPAQFWYRDLRLHADAPATASARQ